MKKKRAILTIALTLGLVGSLSAQSRFGFKLGEGLSYMSVGDINAGAQGMSDLYGDIFAQEAGGTISGGYQPFHLGASFSAEFFFELSPRIAVGLGVGYFRGSGESSLTRVESVDQVEISWKPEVAVVPLTLNLHYSLPVGKRLKLILTAGGGMYLANGIWEWAFQENVTRMDLSATGFGAHGGLGLELELSPSFALTLDLIGRYAQTGALTGEYRTEFQSESGGTLWNVEQFYFRLGTYPVLVYSKIDLSDDPTARESRLDLSGFAATVGILIRL